ncbi:hypothetical protein PAPYR_12544 [Paratrimastix pyriformis]|uniref:Uncharacterized protein n=1 Tax=Paratrimastix pyriformis TaxID=342808 RepID=A0ABQ8U5I6_9EUKA|nr:hypothetical protein PAPYR_12544 [Paratrimastix pyriformis]
MEDAEFMWLRDDLRPHVDGFVEKVQKYLTEQLDNLKTLQSWSKRKLFEYFEPDMHRMLYQIVLMTEMIKCFDEAINYIQINCRANNKLQLDAPGCTTLIKYLGKHNYEINQCYNYNNVNIDVDANVTNRGDIRCLFQIADHYDDYLRFREDLDNHRIEHAGDSDLFRHFDKIRSFYCKQTFRTPKDTVALQNFIEDPKWVEILKN